jgi:hypothetical protein
VFLQDDLKQSDPDRYLISLFARPERQEALWALFLFNHEIAKTRFVVTETQLGLIRLQWWREEIAKLYNDEDAPDNPILKGLENAIRDYALPKALFDNMIFAREFDLEGVAPQGIDGLESYADLTTTPLNKMALQIAGEEVDEDVMHAVSIRYCLTKLFLNISFHKAYGLELITEDVKSEVIAFLSRQYEEAHPNKLRSDGSKILNAQKNLCDIYFKKLKRCHFDPEHKRLLVPPAFKELRVWIKVNL